MIFHDLQLVDISNWPGFLKTLTGKYRCLREIMQNLEKKLAETYSSKYKLYSVSARYNMLCVEVYSVWKEWWVMKSWCPGVSCAPLGLIISSWHPMFYMGSCCPGNNSSHLILKRHFICPCQFVRYTQVGPKTLSKCTLWLDI